MKALSLFVMVLIVSCQSAFAQDWAKARLDKSPRHLEWVKVRNGDRAVNCFVAYPEVKSNATTVVVIHEIFGLADWVRLVTDQFAAAGYIAIAPDLLSGMGPKGGGTESIGGADGPRKAISELPPEQITGDLNAVCKYASEIPSANGKLAVAGFCWGGGQSFRFATTNQGIKCELVFYGRTPDKSSDEEFARIGCPIYGFYGENDARVTATLPATAAVMKRLGKKFESAMYQKAGHGFMRTGEAPDAPDADKRARAQAWTRVRRILNGL